MAFKDFFNFNSLKQKQNGFKSGWTYNAADAAAIMKNDFYNDQSGIGGSGDVLTASYNTPPVLGNFQYYDNIYRNNLFARKIIDCPAQDMIRKWRQFVYDDVDIVEQRQKAEVRYRVADRVKDAVRYANLYGGSALLIVLKNSENIDYSTPFNIKMVKKGSLEKLQPVFLGEIFSAGVTQYNPSQKGFADSEFYSINNLGMVHHSWIIKFVGVPLTLYAKIMQQTFGDSKLTSCMDLLNATKLIYTSIANLAAKANIDMIGVKDFDHQAAMNPEKLFASLGFTKRSPGNVGFQVMDAEGTFTRHTLSGMDGLEKILMMYLQMLASAVPMPLTKFLGTSVDGFSSGENEIVEYYDNIHAQQAELEPQIRMIDKIMEMSLFGNFLDIDYEWLPLYTPTAAEAADINLKNAQMMQIHSDLGVITPQIMGFELRKQGLYDALTEEFIQTQLSDEVVEDASDEDLKSLLGGASVKEA
jgi:phage-related protein (TIGR01555 family)